MFDAFAVIIAMLALGMTFARLRVLPDNAAVTLNLVVLYACLPAAVLKFAPKLHLDLSLFGLILTPWLMMVCTIAIVWPVSRWLKFSRKEYAAILMCTITCNSSFIGYPMTRVLFGDEGLPYAVIYDQFGIFLILSTVGMYILARYSSDTAPDAKMMLKRIIRFPPSWALLFGLTVMRLIDPLPGWLDAILTDLSDAILPLVMLAVGLTIRLKLPVEELKPLAVGLVMKLLVLPALALGVSVALGMDALMLQVNVLETAMPAMITASALAITHNLAPRLVAAMVGYGILLSIATAPMWAAFLRWFVA